MSKAFFIAALCIKSLFAQNIKFDFTKPIVYYKPAQQLIKDNGVKKLIIREFYQGKNKFALAINLQTYQTQIIAANKLTLLPFDIKKLKFHTLLKKYTHFTSLTNNGIKHSTHKADKKIYLTIDMCPSSKNSFEKELFKKLIENFQTKPIHISISISGKWIKTHTKDFLWLVKQNKENKLHITWINHSYTHPYIPFLPLNKNFLLTKNTNLDKEVLELEKLLLSFNELPSVFIRFPGLVANKNMLKAMQKRYFLFPVGADAWIAKHEPILQGSIVLVHGNLNEHQGVTSFLKYLKANPSTTFGDIKTLLQ